MFRTFVVYFVPYTVIYNYIPPTAIILFHSLDPKLAVEFLSEQAVRNSP